MPTRPTALGFIAAFDKLLAYLGPEAFGVIDIALFHTGPIEEIIHEVFGKAKNSVTRAYKKHSNKAHAKRLSRKLHAFMLEDTRAGDALESFDLYKYFGAKYFPDILAGEEEADKVWRYLSRKFAASLSGKVATCVCGAGRARVFLTEELPELVRNDKIETINNVPWKVIRDAYFSDPTEGPDKAYKMICRSEMRLAWDRAKNEATKESVEDFYYTRAYYRAWCRRDMTTKGKPLLPAFRKRTIKEQKAELTALKARLIPSVCP